MSDNISFTDKEEEALTKIKEFVSVFAELPEQHPSDINEVVSLVHKLQEKIMARPVARTDDRFTNVNSEEETK